MPVKYKYLLCVALLWKTGCIAKTKGGGHMVSGTTDLVKCYDAAAAPTHHT